MTEASINREERRRLLDEANRRWASMVANPIALDLTRGKPCAEQLDLSSDLLGLPGAGGVSPASGTDCRNYGGLEGLPEARALLGEILEVAPERVVAGGNSSLSLMYQVLAFAALKGVPGGDAPWSATRPRFICPTPGYDRHFSVTEHLGFEMLPVEISDTAIDLEAIARLAGSDPAVKGIWLVPRYSNPTGLTLSPEAVRGLASMRTAAPDFRIVWDNAYAVHSLGGEPDPLASITAECERAGNADRVWMFASTSKITFAGAGISAFAASEANLKWFLSHYAMTTIGADKINQLRHVRFFENVGGIHAHMDRHARILRPKFDAVHTVFEKALGPLRAARWTRPRGGYFVSLDVADGKASRVVSLAAEAGVKLTPAGATFPYGKDPRDRNIRIAPTFPTLPELEQAASVVATAVLVAD